MPLQMLLALFFIVGLPIGWLIAEFNSSRRQRITLGLLSIFCGYVVAAGVGITTKLNYNAWFGFATKDLISTTIEQVEEGQHDRVLTVLRDLDRQYHPTYESRANYLELVKDATARMRGDVEVVEGSDWDATESSVD